MSDLRDVVRQAAQGVWNEPSLSAPEIIDVLADAVAVSTLMKARDSLNKYINDQYPQRSIGVAFSVGVLDELLASLEGERTPQQHGK